MRNIARPNEVVPHLRARCRSRERTREKGKTGLAPERMLSSGALRLSQDRPIHPRAC